jgi:hypothetical protein
MEDTFDNLLWGRVLDEYDASTTATLRSQEVNDLASNRIPYMVSPAIENETASLRKCGHAVETFMKRPDWSPLQRIHQACVVAGRKASNQAVLTNQFTGSTDCTNHPGPRGFSR